MSEWAIRHYVMSKGQCLGKKEKERRKSQEEVEQEEDTETFHKPTHLQFKCHKYVLSNQFYTYK